MAAGLRVHVVAMATGLRVVAMAAWLRVVAKAARLRSAAANTSSLARHVFFVDNASTETMTKTCGEGEASKPTGDSNAPFTVDTGVDRNRNRDGTTASAGNDASNDHDCWGRIRKSYVTRMLLWTLLVEIWMAWTPNAVHNYFLIRLLFLVFVGVLVILKLHRFRVSWPCVKSGLVYTLTVMCAGGVLAVTSQHGFLRYEHVVKKFLIKEYERHMSTGPHAYVVASGLALMTCVARGLHRRR